MARDNTNTRIVDRLPEGEETEQERVSTGGERTLRLHPRQPVPEHGTRPH